MSSTIENKVMMFYGEQEGKYYMDDALEIMSRIFVVVLDSE
jgi:hypothetical protein